MKTCRTCQESKPLDAFYIRKRPGSRFLDCKTCVLKKSRERYKLDPQMRERIIAQATAWQLANPERVKEIRADRPAWRLRQYGMTEAEYVALLESQGGCCAICGTDEPLTRWNAWHVDHDHETGTIRGLLCHRCNVGLGHFLDDPVRLRAALDYLERVAEMRAA